MSDIIPGCRERTNFKSIIIMYCETEIKAIVYADIYIDGLISSTTCKQMLWVQGWIYS